MSAPESSRARPGPATDDEGETSWSDTESESSFAGSGASTDRDAPARPHRDARHHDGECARFLDCPTHVVERALAPDESRPGDAVVGDVGQSGAAADGGEGQSGDMAHVGGNRPGDTVSDGGERPGNTRDIAEGRTSDTVDGSERSGDTVTDGERSGDTVAHEDDPSSDATNVGHHGPADAVDVDEDRPGDVLDVAHDRSDTEDDADEIEPGQEQNRGDHGAPQGVSDQELETTGLAVQGGSVAGGQTSGHPSEAASSQPTAGVAASSEAPITLFEALRDIRPEPADADAPSPARGDDGQAGVPSAPSPPAVEPTTSSRPTSPSGQGPGPLSPPAALPARPAPPPPTADSLDIITLPPWQSDAEVASCPICQCAFGFFNRKHHCRKCGRVVCNKCSPHRITIPHQYIVRPPGEFDVIAGLLGEEGAAFDSDYVGGGEPVRLCNPCVPDPNTTPPQAPQSPMSGHQRSRSSISGVSQFGVDRGSPSDAYIRNRSATMSNMPAYPSAMSPYTRAFASSSQHAPDHASSSRGPSTIAQPRPQAPFLSFFDSSQPSSSSSPATNRPLPPPPRIPEEDECPVCHEELPKRNLPNFETAREQHITTCITQHSAYRPSASAANNTPGAPGVHGTPPVRARRRTGMFPYTATEKDCADNAECSICFEDYEAGVAMARLECLCKFHRRCIDAWWVKNPGRCPVHQHDSFGY